VVNVKYGDSRLVLICECKSHFMILFQFCFIRLTLLRLYYILSVSWLIDYLQIYIPLKNFSLIWRCHHYRWRAAKFRSNAMLGVQGLGPGRDLYRITLAVTLLPPWSIPSNEARCSVPESTEVVRMLLAVTWGLSFPRLIRRTAPFNRLLRHARRCWGPILTRILKNPSVN
jgi:hypothetical protein